MIKVKHNIDNSCVNDELDNSCINDELNIVINEYQKSIITVLELPIDH